MAFLLFTWRQGWSRKFPRRTYSPARHTAENLRQRIALHPHFTTDLIGQYHYSPIVHKRPLVNNSVDMIRFTNHGKLLCCSQFIERTKARGGGRKKAAEALRIIPGDWGKAEPGWLARPLQERIARFGGGGKIHQPLWRRSRAVSDAIRGLAARGD